MTFATRPVLLFLAIVPALAATASPAFAAPPPAPQQYTLTDLGTLGGTQSHAYFVNKHGQVAGDSLTQNSGRHAFLWDNGTMRDIGLLGTDGGTVTGLNDLGDVIFNRESSPGQFRALLWSGGTLFDIGALPGDDSAQALAINNRGQVVGTSSDTYGQTHAFMWEKGSMTHLETLGGTHTYAYLINDAGQAAGYALANDFEAHAVLWDRGQIIDLASPLSSSPCFCFSIAQDLNARGDVVGNEFSFVTMTSAVVLWAAGTRTAIATGDSSATYSAVRLNDRGEVSGNRHTLSGGQPDLNPFFWSAGTLTEWNREAVTSRATAMNRDGQVVGEASNGSTGIQGFVRDAGVVTELAWPSYSTAADINDRGVIVGSAFIPNSGIHAVIWTRTNP